MPNLTAWSQWFDSFLPAELQGWGGGLCLLAVVVLGILILRWRGTNSAQVTNSGWGTTNSPVVRNVSPGESARLAQARVSDSSGDDDSGEEESDDDEDSTDDDGFPLADEAFLRRAITRLRTATPNDVLKAGRQAIAEELRELRLEVVVNLYPDSDDEDDEEGYTAKAERIVELELQLRAFEAIDAECYIAALIDSLESDIRDREDASPDELLGYGTDLPEF